MEQTGPTGPTGLSCDCCSGYTFTKTNSQEDYKMNDDKIPIPPEPILPAPSERNWPSSKDRKSNVNNLAWSIYNIYYVNREVVKIWLSGKDKPFKGQVISIRKENNVVVSVTILSGFAFWKREIEILIDDIEAISPNERHIGG
jgi:hypothetical protein